MGLDNVIVPDVDALTTVGVGCSQLEWGRGELEWEAEMRKLDMQVCLSACLLSCLTCMFVTKRSCCFRATELVRSTKPCL